LGQTTSIAEVTHGFLEQNLFSLTMWAYWPWVSKDAYFYVHCKNIYRSGKSAKREEMLTLASRASQQRPPSWGSG
jgi:hypothetical protein